MKIIRPLQLSFNNQVLEQNRRFFFTASATLGVNLGTGKECLDVNYFKDMYDCMGTNTLPDMGMPKPNGEFLVSGKYFAPGNQPVSGGEVKIRLDKSEKKLYVFGERQWKAGIPSKPVEITSLHLDYTKAFGGMGFEKNPSGIGYKDGLLPCIEDPKTMVASTRDEPDPAGFSSLHPSLPQRMQYQGTYEADYRETYFPGYPADHDWKYFLCAPPDQRIENYYQGDEQFGIYNMHPEIPVIEGRFPGLYARCFINRIKKGDKVFGELALNLDTIWFFPEKLLALLIFRGVVEVEDDEAENITHVLCAYEDKSQAPRSLEYYKTAFERRENSSDALLTNLNTPDLIPDGHPSAMALLMDTALNRDDENEFAKNIDAKAQAMQEMADEKIEAATRNMEQDLSGVDVPDGGWEHLSEDAKKHISGSGGGFDIKNMMRQTTAAESDPDFEKFNIKLESILPGMTAGDSKKLDMNNFSFDRMDELFDAVDVLLDKKEKEASTLVQKEIEKAKSHVKEKIERFDDQIQEAKTAAGSEGSEGSEGSDRVKTLEDSKKKMNQSLDALEHIDPDRTSESQTPLPRIDVKEITTSTDQVNPRIMEAMHHVQSMKDMGIEDEKTKEMEKQLQDMMEINTRQIEKGLQEAESGFKEGYIMAAHFLDRGLSPHRDSLEKVKQRFLEAISKSEKVSGGDWACIDLSGEALDGIDLSGAFLEQVNFKGATLRHVNFSNAILTRADLENADLTGANFENANVGAVNARHANFTNANMKSAILSKGDFTESDFTKADLEQIESFEIVITGANFTQTHMPKINFIEINFSGATFLNADMTTCVFLKCSISNSDFSESNMTKCAFVDTQLKTVCFEKADLSSACFVATGSEKPGMKDLNFKKACLKQANFQDMDMKGSNLTYANMENAFFGGADLTESDLSHSQAKFAQFRKAGLTRAKLNRINLDQGSLAKANLSGASFVGANLHAVDFLRSTMGGTDFTGSNLDTTLIEHWRPI